MSPGTPSAAERLPRGAERSGPRLVPPAEHEPSSARVVALLLGVALLPRLLLLAVNENLYGDAVIRTELAERWWARPHWIASFDDGAFQFGPLHLYLMAFAVKLVPAREHAGRVLSLVFGVLTVWPLHALTRRLFGWQAAVWACLAFAAWGIHLQLSTTAASEALGLFLVMWMLALFAQGLEENRFAPIAYAAAVLNLACATRYDAWLMIPLFCGLLLLGDKDRIAAVTRAVFFGFLCLPFPLAWMQGNELDKGSALYPVHFIDQFHVAWFQEGVALWGDIPYRLQNLFFWPGVALFTLTPLVALFGAAGMVRSWRERRDLRWLLWVAWLPAAYFTFRSTVLGSFVPLGRFAVNQVALLLPFVAFGFTWMLGRANPALRKAVAGLAVACAVAFPMWLGLFTFHAEGSLQETLRPVSPTSTNPEAVMKVARYLADEAAAKGGAAIIDTDPNYRDLQIAFFSGLPEPRMARHRWEIFPVRLADADPHFLVRIEGGTLAQRPDFEIGSTRVRLGENWFDEVPGFQAPFHVYRR
ncbi:MAG: ArnT family glycosyltransferase [Myxococcaceae bacterium]